MESNNQSFKNKNCKFIRMISLLKLLDRHVWDLSSQLSDLIRSFTRLMMFVWALYFSRMASRRSTNSFRCFRKFAVLHAQVESGNPTMEKINGGVHVCRLALPSTVFGWIFAFWKATVNTHLGGLDLQSHKNTQQGWMKGSLFWVAEMQLALTCKPANT